MRLTNQVMLITYPNSLGRNLNELEQILNRHFKSAIGGLHLLPFFPSSGDRGFSPMTYQQVDPSFGSWSNIDSLGQSYYLMFDLMVNHLSRQSTAFQDYLKNGAKSPAADMFLNWDQFWPEGRPTKSDIDQIYRRKDKLPKQEVTFADGSKTNVWNTFGDEQIDLDVRNSKTRDFLQSVLATFKAHHASIVRLDAFAYAIKKLNTNDFFVEPEIWQLLDWTKQIVEPWNMKVLPEIHEHYSYAQKVNQHGYLTYDFVLPMVVLYTLYSKNPEPLIKWLRISPMRQFTTLDTHDGIGVVDAKDILSDNQIQFTTEQLYKQGSNVKRLYSTAAYNNLDVYQINTTFYSALNEDDNAYLLARAIQIFAPGIPQIYYVGLLSGNNDLKLLEQTKEGRNINRHYYSAEEVATEVQRPVVRHLVQMLSLRNKCAAFDLKGSLSCRQDGENSFTLVRKNATESCSAELRVNLTDRSFSISVDGKTVFKQE